MKAFLRPGLLLLPALLLGLLPASSPAQFGISVSITTAPPPLVEYSQPPCPDEGYLWEPGYWAWGSDGYYWVPGAWVEPPQPGVVWTPGYWAFENGDYVWNEGYWAPEVGFYGGVDYGFGYPGEGFYGGMWQGGVFVYNDAYWHVDRDRIHHVYDRRADFHESHDRASFNGRGGIQARPTPQDERAMHTQHFQPTQEQIQHRNTVANNPQYQYKANHGKPSHPAMARPAGGPARNQQRPAVQQGRQNTRPMNARPNQQPRQPAAQRPMPAQRPQAQPRPENRPQNHPQPSRPQPQNRPQNHPQPSRPQPQNRPMPRPQPQSRPERPPQSRPAQRPEQRPQSRPAPEQRPQSRPAPRPQPRAESRPAAPRPQSRPAPHPESHPKAPEKPHS